MVSRILGQRTIKDGSIPQEIGRKLTASLQSCIQSSSAFLDSGEFRGEPLEGALNGVRDPVVLAEIQCQGFTFFLVRGQREGADPRKALSPRERVIARLVSEGLRNKNIAAFLGISTHTVANHLQRIYRKWHIKSRVDLVREAIASGIKKASKE